MNYDGPDALEAEDEPEEEEIEMEVAEEMDPLDDAWIAQMLSAEIQALADLDADPVMAPIVEANDEMDAAFDMVMDMLEEEEEVEEMPAIEMDCTCLQQHGLPVYWTQEGVHYIEYTDEDGVVYQYPPSYGTGSCDKAWDLELAPICADADGMPLADAPEHCAQEWCWVNPDTCDLGIQTTFFPDSNLWFSYEVCSMQDEMAAEEMEPAVEEETMEEPVTEEEEATEEPAAEEEAIEEEAEDEEAVEEPTDEMDPLDAAWILKFQMMQAAADAAAAEAAEEAAAMMDNEDPLDSAFDMIMEMFNDEEMPVEEEPTVEEEVAEEPAEEEEVIEEPTIEEEVAEEPAEEEVPEEPVVEEEAVEEPTDEMDPLDAAWILKFQMMQAAADAAAAEEAAAAAEAAEMGTDTAVVDAMDAAFQMMMDMMAEE